MAADYRNTFRFTSPIVLPFPVDDCQPVEDVEFSDDDLHGLECEMDAVKARAEFRRRCASLERTTGYRAGVRVSVGSSETSQVAKLKMVGACIRSVAGGLRGEVTKFSRASRMRLAERVSNLPFVPQQMFCLTFGETFPHDGRIAFSMFNAWMQRARPIVGQYVAFPEFQGRGAIHRHILFEKRLTRGQEVYLSNCWARICRRYLSLSVDEYRKVKKQHRRAANWQPIRSKDGAARYALKYAYKLRQKDVPEGFTHPGRFWSTSRGACAGWDVYHVPFADWSEVLERSDALALCARADGRRATRAPGAPPLSNSTYLNREEMHLVSSARVFGRAEVEALERVLCIGGYRLSGQLKGGSIPMTRYPDNRYCVRVLCADGEWHVYYFQYQVQAERRFNVVQTWVGNSFRAELLGLHRGEWEVMREWRLLND